MTTEAELLDQIDMAGEPVTDDTPVCKHCGSVELRSIEIDVAWVTAAFVRDENGEYRPDWDLHTFDAGDSDYDTVGIACSNCGEEIGGQRHQPPFDTKDLITTLGEYRRLNFGAGLAPTRGGW